MARFNPLEAVRSRIDPAWLVPVLGRLPFRFNPLSPSARRDPHAQYRRLRESQPVYKSPLLKGWLLTEYDDVCGVLRDPRFSSDQRNSPREAEGNARFAEECPELHRFAAAVITSMDAPEHTRLRSLVNKAFTPRIVGRLEPRIQEIVDECVDAALAKGSIEVVSELAFPLPVKVISEMLGVDAADANSFREWASNLFALTDPIAMLRVETRSAAEQSVREMRQYLADKVSERRAQPREDLLSALVVAEDQGKRLSEDELLSMCGALVLAGHETTTNLIATAIHCLLRYPLEYQRLRAAPELLPSAIEEVLRFEGVAHLLSRIALEDVEVGSGPYRATVRKGEMVLLGIAAANRDPKHFPEPDRFDIGRSPNRHLGFGHGVHFCLGANLARAEAVAAVRAVVERLPEFEGISAESKWKPNPLLRGLERLELSWS